MSIEEMTAEELVAEAIKTIDGQNFAPQHYLDCARAALSVLEQAGYVVVPRDLTPAMGDAGLTALEACERGETATVLPMRPMWSAMLAAAKEEK